MMREITDEQLEAIELEVGHSANGWDMVNPKELIAAVLKVCGTERIETRVTPQLITEAEQVVNLLVEAGEQTEWADGDETDRVFAWHELAGLVGALADAREAPALPGEARHWADKYSELPEMLGELSDEDLARRVRMLGRNDLDFEAVVTAARDRIARLSRRVHRLLRQFPEPGPVKPTPTTPLGYEARVRLNEDVSWAVIQRSGQREAEIIELALLPQVLLEKTARQRRWLRAAVAMAATIRGLRELIEQSRGVAGLHRNDELADWEWLIEHDWLGDWTAVEEAMLGLPPIVTEPSREDRAWAREFEDLLD